MSDNSMVEYKVGETNIALNANVVRQYLVSGSGNVSDQEVFMFMNLCKSQGLNPFIREAYLIKYGSSAATIVIGKDVFTKRASNNPLFMGYEAGIVVRTKDDGFEYRHGSVLISGEPLVGGWAKVYLKGYQVPIEDAVSILEYKQNTPTWNKMPATMIRKVALVHALREAFPGDFQGLYDASEMKVDDTTLETNSIIIEDVSSVPHNDTKGNKRRGVGIITTSQAKRMFAISNGNAELCKAIIAAYGYDHSDEIKVSDYDQICEEIADAVDNLNASQVENDNDMSLPWEVEDNHTLNIPELIP